MRTIVVGNFVYSIRENGTIWINNNETGSAILLLDHNTREVTLLKLVLELEDKLKTGE